MAHCIVSKARKAQVSLRKNPKPFDSSPFIRTYLAVMRLVLLLLAFTVAVNLIVENLKGTGSIVLSMVA